MSTKHLQCDFLCSIKNLIEYVHNYKNELFIAFMSCVIFIVGIFILMYSIKYKFWLKNCKILSGDIIINCNEIEKLENLPRPIKVQTLMNDTKFTKLYNSNLDFSGASSADENIEEIEYKQTKESKMCKLTLVQPKDTTHTKVHSSSSSDSKLSFKKEESADDDLDIKEPKLTLSLSFDESKNKIKLTLIKSKNLKRINNKYSTKNIFQRNTAPFVGLNVFARIYRKEDKLNSFEQRRNTLTQLDQFTMTEMDHRNSEEECNNEKIFIETKPVKSKKAETVKFSDKDNYYLDRNDFPIRISLYESDHNNTRFTLGHCFIDLESLIFANKIVIKRILHSNIYDAQNSNEK